MSETDIRRIDLNLLWVFQAVYRERNQTRAARRLNLTQPALSHSLARLRDLFRDPLFVRVARGMEPTAEAQRLAPMIDAALHSITAALQPADRFDPQTATQAIQISLLDYEAALLLPRLSARLAAEAPGLDLRTRHVRGPDALALLDAGDIDLAIGVYPGDHAARFAFESLFEERFIVIARRNHPRLSGPVISLDDYCRESHVLVSFRGDSTGRVDQELAGLGRQRRVALTVAHFHVAPFAVAETDLIATVPARLAEIYRHLCPIALFDPPLPLPAFTEQAAWHRRREGDGALAWFRSLLHQVAADLPQPIRR